MELSNQIAEYMSKKYKSKNVLGGPVYQLMYREGIRSITNDIQRLGWAVYGGPPTSVEVNSCLGQPYDTVITFSWGSDTYYIRVKFPPS